MTNSSSSTTQLNGERSPLRQQPSHDIASTVELENGGPQSVRDSEPGDNSRRSANTSSSNHSHNGNSSHSRLFAMDHTKGVLFKVGLDFVILLTVGFPILFFFLWGDPYQRGFFCDDESLRHPFHESTVRNWMLYIIGLILPIGTMLFTESFLASRRGQKQSGLRIFNWDVPEWVRNSYKQIGVFGFGAACSQLTTDIAKYSIGRLRPHFYTLCKPIILPDKSSCNDSWNQGRYIENFECSNDSTKRLLKEMRLSFPSGHSSFSTYTLIYLVIYLQARMTWRGSKLLRHFLQYLFIMMSWYTCLSRISDYKHHWSDVLAGATLGVICALLVTNYVSDLFKQYRSRSSLPLTLNHENATTTMPSNL